ncbi:MAG: putative photosynthetic complex assembly protein PuhE [Rhizobiaceae bacterium]
MAFALPAIFALFVWWFATGAIIWLDGLARHTFKWSMAGATLLALAGFYGLHASAGGTELADAYIAFAAVMAVWAWLEISFYLGWVTGLQKHRCPHGCSGWRHFGHALRANIWHELAIIVFLAAIVWLTWGAENQIGLWTFLILWWMHESARINVFLGVRNLNEHFVPDHLDFLKGFLRKAEMNLFFPVSVTVSTAACAWLVFAAATATTPFEQAGFTFMAAMMTLAIIEHWFLMLPLPFDRLWNWSLGSRKEPAKGRSLSAIAPGPMPIAIASANENQTVHPRPKTLWGMK